MTPDARASAVAALWGFAEATVFFLVPDVHLTAVALRDRRTALRACLAAVGGALLGGWLMFAWGAREPAAARRLLDRVPAVSPAMLARVEAEIATRGAVAMFLGPLRGTPYKTYAVLAGERSRRDQNRARGAGAGPDGDDLLVFLAVSVPARLLRFVLLTLVAAWVAARPLAGWSLRRRRLLHAALWGSFYIVYFLLIPN
jgi:membrane protein YqaA with SNARE-associated domain